MNHKVENRQVPDWAKGIDRAFQAYHHTRSVARERVGYGSSTGSLDDEYYGMALDRLYLMVRRLKSSLPEFIGINRIPKGSAPSITNFGFGTIVDVGRQNEYLLTETFEVYRYNPIIEQMYGQNIEEIDPQGEDFLGFDQIRAQTPSKFYPVGRSLNDFNAIGYEGINKVVSNISTEAGNSKVRGEVHQLEADLVEIRAEKQRSLKLETTEFATRIRHSTEVLRDAVMATGNPERLESRLDLGVYGDDTVGQISRLFYFMDSNRLVQVFKTWHIQWRPLRLSMEHNFKRALEASDRKWLDVLLGEKMIELSLPKETYELIVYGFRK